MSERKALLGPMRLPFLILTPACVLLGIGVAKWTSGRVSVLHAILALIGAVSAHISVNALNEYFDFKSGLDSRTVPTPFSGGSGTLPRKPELERKALTIGLISFALTGAIGVFFLFVRGLPLLPLGIFGLLIIFAYTPWLTRNPWACLIAPGLGFGTMMVMGTSLVLTGEYSWSAFVASLVPFFLVSDLLLLNQFPDVEADKSVGRRHLPIVAGRRTSSLVYAAFLLLAYVAIGIGVWLRYLPIAGLLGFATFPLAVRTAAAAIRYAEDTPKLIPHMAMNVILNIATPTLVAIGLFLG